MQSAVSLKLHGFVVKVRGKARMFIPPSLRIDVNEEDFIRFETSIILEEKFWR